MSATPEQQLKRIIAESQADILKHISATQAEILVNLRMLSDRLDTMQGTVNTMNGGSKKTPVKKGGAVVSSFPVNFMTWFKEEFKSNEEFRNNFLKDEDLKKRVEEEAKYKTAKTADAKNTVAATFVLNNLKGNKPDDYKKYVETYENLKTKWNEEAKQEQLKEVASDDENAGKQNVESADVKETVDATETVKTAKKAVPAKKASARGKKAVDAPKATAN